MYDYVAKPLGSVFDCYSWFATNLGLMFGAGIAIGILFALAGAAPWFVGLAFLAAFLHWVCCFVVWTRRDAIDVWGALAVVLALGGLLGVVLWLCTPALAADLPAPFSFIGRWFIPLIAAMHWGLFFPFLALRRASLREV